MKFVICTSTGGAKLWLNNGGRWTPDRHGARVFTTGETFQIVGNCRIWMELA